MTDEFTLSVECELPEPLLGNLAVEERAVRQRQERRDRLVTRREWGARPGEPGPGRLIRKNVDGIALHWPGMRSRLETVREVSAALRNWQDFHMDTNGWSDIAYQLAFDQRGNRYRLRGMGFQSAANGSVEMNQRFGAYLLVLAIGETPSDEMIAAVRRAVHGFRNVFPRATAILGHRDVRPEPTQCPGDIVDRMIDDGVFRPRRRP